MGDTPKPPAGSILHLFFSGLIWDSYVMQYKASMHRASMPIDTAVSIGYAEIPNLSVTCKEAIWSGKNRYR